MQYNHFRILIYSSIFDIFGGQLPYLILSSVIFVIPYFYIVGFDKDGATDKFFWYWLYQGLYMSVMVFLGHLLACALPNPPSANGVCFYV